MEQVVALFSGAGGFSRGFANNGVRPSIAAEINIDARASYEANLGVPALPLDLGAVNAPAILRGEALGSPVWAVIGGPPCQGFSSAGARQTKDPRNKLILNYFRIVESLKPKWFLFENVEGLLTSEDGAALQELARRFLGLGYSIRIEKINFASFGLPQSRKRVIIAGNRLGIDFQFPLASHSYDAGKHKSCSKHLPLAPSLLTAISDLPEPSFKLSMREADGIPQDHFWNASSADLARIELLKPGQTMRDLPLAHQHGSFQKRANRRVADGVPTEKRGGAPAGLRRLLGDKVSPTITSASSREFVHPVHNRPLTLRECARLQAFMDTDVFLGDVRAKATQIGNAVPPLASGVLANMLLTADGLAGSGVATRSSFHTTPVLLGYHLTDSVGLSPALLKARQRLDDLCQTRLFDIAERDARAA